MRGGETPMWLYDSLVLLSVVMFGGGFALQDIYRKIRGSSLKISMESTCIGALAGLAVLLVINGFSFELTSFTLLMAFLATINGMLFAFCTFKALDHINLSLFSLFAMLGGMLLPFLQGWLFYGEALTPAKIACVIFVCASLFCTLQKGNKKKGLVYDIGVFVLNGMAGVISKIFTESELPKASAAGYSVWIALLTVLLSGAAWFALALSEKRGESHASRLQSEEHKFTRLQSYGIGALYGAVNKVANFLLVIALVHIDASVQYPMVTGGTIVVSTVISCLEGKRPDRRELLSVGLALIGLLSLFFIPLL